MNHGDTFVLDAGNIIFVWRGVDSTGAEGLAAAKLAARLRNKIGEQVRENKFYRRQEGGEGGGLLSKKSCF